MGIKGVDQTVFFLDSVHSHDSSAEFGISPNNPIQVKNVFMEYAYLDSLYFEDGQDVIYSRVATCQTDSGHTMDQYEIKRPGEEGVFCHLYFDAYVSEPIPNVPKGFYMKIGDDIVRHGLMKDSRSSNSNGKGCLLLLILLLAIFLCASSLIAKALY